ncbi:hypothetical protein H9L14_02490 [Sphingomonas sediminicola]|uniref:Uncharacterized protein n=1 Tax=Sphingomonas sediminicola TaxID=386874 RepID=A0ABX6T8F5_9SPHN|nr:hypothetical protein [Sphingomonas sediminicola]QNP46147.1 hypothetical protein H9L14_02490 [Sphingomonas sediminicola]
MKMLRIPEAQFTRKQYAFREMGEPKEQPAGPRSTMAKRQTERLQIGGGPGDEGCKVCGGNRQRRLCEDIESPTSFGLVGIGAGFAGTGLADAEGIDGDALLAQRLDLAPDEGMRSCRILAREIGDAHFRPLAQRFRA